MTLKDFLHTVTPVEHISIIHSLGLHKDKELLYNKKYSREIKRDIEEQGKDLDDYYVANFCSLTDYDNHISYMMVIVREAVDVE